MVVIIKLRYKNPAIIQQNGGGVGETGSSNYRGFFLILVKNS